MKPAHPQTRAALEQVRQSLDFEDTRDFDDARRGFIGTLDDAHTIDDRGEVAWSMKPYGFVGDATPSTVHPSLWRLARLNAVHGLFQVTDRIYQVRGFSLANVTFVEGDTGLIAIDPLTYVEHAQAALRLYTAHRGPRAVRAIIYTHSHRDHYGGAGGIVSEQQVLADGIDVIAPDGFLDEAFSETMLAGVPMRRRSLFQFGTTLPPGPMGHIDSGLGKAVGRGRDGLIPPNRLVRQAVERHVIDGLEFVFHATPGTEAPAEMNIHLPGLRALNLAENACHTMHNLCPLRGAKTRDALAWSRYLDEALQRFVPDVDVVYAQHQWPVWGQSRIHQFVAGQRDLYRYLHDQTLRWMSHGLTPAEIGERLLLPNRLSRQWFARGYYGAVVHNVAAIYAHYLGPYDGNPAHLHPLPPQEEGARYVSCMGGAQKVISLAQDALAKGDFRWAVQLLNHLVFSQPDHAQARALQADAMEQLGYQAESATWRNAYLLGAQELRTPRSRPAHTTLPISADMVALLPLDKFLELLAIRIDGERAQHLEARFDWSLIDPNDPSRDLQPQCVTLSNGALSHLPGRHGERADAQVRCTRGQLIHLLQGPAPALHALDTGALECLGDRERFRQFLGTLDVFDPMFNVVEP